MHMDTDVRRNCQEQSNDTMRGSTSQTHAGIHMKEIISNPEDTPVVLDGFNGRPNYISEPPESVRKLTRLESTRKGIEAAFFFISIQRVIVL